MWALTGDGNFTIRSAYNLCAGIHAAPEKTSWDSLWNWKGPHQVQMHLWKPLHGRLLTNLYKSRWCNDSPRCHNCTGVPESILHVLRDCPLASQVWVPLLKSQLVNEFYNLSLQDWISSNLKQSFGLVEPGQWCNIFCSACYFLWECQNGVISKFFMRTSLDHDPSKVVLEYASHIGQAFVG